MKHHLGTIQAKHMATVFINLFCPKLFQETSHHRVNYHESSNKTIRLSSHRAVRSPEARDYQFCTM